MSDNNPTVVGVLIPEFPTQTHVAWWRVGHAMRSLGVEMQMLSTRRPPLEDTCHEHLRAESQRTHYCWPPAWRGVLTSWLRHPSRLWRGLRYVSRLEESRFGEKLKLLPLIPAATDLFLFCEQRSVEAIFVHSCANAAHLAAMCHEMGGPRYALRLGGDLQVYGKDHPSKMRRAEFIASAAPSYVADIVGQARVPEQRIMWTWVGVDVETFTPRDRFWERQHPDELRAVTIARLNRTKGHQDVLRAIALLRDREIFVRYRIVGSGPFADSIRILCEELELQEQVEFLGALGTEDVVSQLRAADVALLASYAVGEGTPGVVAEAMACGVPVICTQIGATHEMLRDRVEGFLVPQRDPQAIADCLEQLAKDAVLRAAMARAALERSAAFDCRLVAAKLLSRFGIESA